MFTQHKGLLPEMVKTESLNNQNKQRDKDKDLGVSHREVRVDTVRMD